MDWSKFTKWFRFKRLQTRMIVFIFGFVALVQIGLLLTVEIANKNIADEEIERYLRSGHRQFSSTVQHREDRLLQAARVLAADFAFREALATGDVPTVQSALYNHGNRINASVSVLLGQDGEVVAYAFDKGSRYTEMEFSNKAITISEDISYEHAKVTWINGRAFQTLAVPVLAPIKIGTLIMGFEINNSLATELAELTGLEITLFDRGTHRSLATTVHDLKWDFHAITEVSNMARIQHDGYEALITRFGRSPRESQGVNVILMVPQGTILAPFHSLSKTLGVLIFLSLSIVALGTALLSRSITRPLSTITTIAHRYAAGDYEGVPKVDRKDEIGLLSRTFIQLRNGILDREHKIKHLAYHDPLTGLANRAAFTEALNSFIQQTQQANPVQQGGAGHTSTFAVLVLDLDRFKDVNILLGHNIGDEILKQVAERLQSVIGKNELIARLGGDEFAILLPDGTTQKAEALGDQIKEALHAPITIKEERIDAVVSIGCAMFPEHGETAASLLSLADIALSRAKETLSGYALYATDLAASQRSSLSLLGELRFALVDNQMELWYQPKLDLKTKQIKEAEALIRWQHPTRGIIPPYEFIEFSERTGFIKHLTSRVLELASDQILQWKQKNFDIKVSINISAKDLFDDDLPPQVESILTNKNIAPSNLCLEITETAAMGSPDRALKILHQLRSLGVQLSIDDFGVGQSSLRYLRQFPVQELKIDRSFITDMCSRSESIVIVRSAIDIAHNMGLEVVAEGVNSHEECEALAAMGCDSIQGFWMTKPLPADEFEQWTLQSPWSNTGQPQYQNEMDDNRLNTG